MKQTKLIIAHNYIFLCCYLRVSPVYGLWEASRNTGQSAFVDGCVLYV